MLAALALLILAVPARADYEIQVRASPVHGTLYLLESLRGAAHVSVHLGEVFRSRRGSHPEDEQALSGYRTLMEESWLSARLPGDGGRPRRLPDVLEGVALDSLDEEDFLRRARPLLSAPDHRRLCLAVRHFGPLYRALIYQPCRAGLEAQMSELRRELDRRQASDCLRRVAVMVDSEWPADLPFEVALTPIPREEGEHFQTFGHSDGYLEVVEAPQGAPVSLGVGVIVHELTHSLWNHRSARIRALEEAMLAQGGGAACEQLNESLATAVGNGWFQGLPGEPPAGEWYADPIIDGYARALLGLARPYLEAPRPLDEAFARQAVAAFTAAFPEAHRQVGIGLRSVLVVSDSEAVQGGEFQEWSARLGPLHSIFAASPLGAPESLRRFQELREGQAALFLVRPQELGLLAPYGWSPQHLAWARQAAAGGLPLVLARWTPEGWRVLLLGSDLSEQKSALEGLVRGGRLTDAFEGR